MVARKRRASLISHLKEIERWVGQGKNDEWIASALGTTPSSVQSFRSRNRIYRRTTPSGRAPGHVEEAARAGPVSAFEGVLDHGARDGWGLWFDSAVADDPIWREHWHGVGSVSVRVTRDAIVLEAADSSGSPGEGPALQGVSVPTSTGANASARDTAQANAVDGDGSAFEQGSIKWFDPKKGYGFVSRLTGDDLFAHVSEVRGDPELLEPGQEVVFEIGHNERGPAACKLRPLDTENAEKDST